MKKYKVKFSMTVTNYYEMIVDAEDEDDAFSIATDDFDEIEDKVNCGDVCIDNDSVEEITDLIINNNKKG